MTTPAAPDAPAPVAWRGLAAVALPPLAVLLLRALLPGEVDGGTLQRLEPATLVSSPGEAFWMAARPLVIALLALGAVVAALLLARRRLGGPRLARALLALWALMWLGLGAWLVASDLNAARRQPLPDEPAKVLLSREILASQRGPGGTEVYIELAGEPQPQRLFAEGQPVAAFVPGSTAVLHAEAGRWWGRWGRLTSRLGAAPATGPGAR